MIVIVLLALAWVVVLIPSVLKPRFETSPIDGVRNFERSMGILANTRSDRQIPGRWVMIPKAMPTVPTTRRQRLIAKRRRLFTQVVAAAGVTFLLGIIPVLRPLWIAHLALDLFIAGYAVYLRRLHAAEMTRRKVVRRLPAVAASAAERNRAASNG